MNYSYSCQIACHFKLYQGFTWCVCSSFRYPSTCPPTPLQAFAAHREEQSTQQVWLRGTEGCLRPNTPIWCLANISPSEAVLETHVLADKVLICLQWSTWSSPDVLADRNMTWAPQSSKGFLSKVRAALEPWIWAVRILQQVVIVTIMIIMLYHTLGVKLRNNYTFTGIIVIF